MTKVVLEIYSYLKIVERFFFNNFLLAFLVTELNFMKPYIDTRAQSIEPHQLS